MKREKDLRQTCQVLSGGAILAATVAALMFLVLAPQVAPSSMAAPRGQAPPRPAPTTPAAKRAPAPASADLGQDIRAEVSETRGAALIRSHHSELKCKICSALDDLLGDPTIGKPLREELAGLRSCRVARFRIICRVAGTVIEILAVGPRHTIYEETWRRVRRNPRSL